MIKDLPAVQAKWKVRLQKAGIEKVHDLIRWKVAGLVALGIPDQEAKELLRKADMITLKGMGIDNYRLLREAGVRDLTELAQQDPAELYCRLEERARLMPAHQRPPFPALVRLWVDAARKNND
jgi:hypothetical protein